MPPVKVIDLFSGAGGFTLGAKLAGLDVVCCIDNDSDLTASHSTNFPNIRLLEEDLSEFDPEHLDGEVDLSSDSHLGLIGGPPCQGFSVIGNRDPEDGRNSLVERFFEFVRYFEPSFFVMENVPGILQGYGEEIVDREISRLDGGYSVLRPLILDASDFGLPTSRRRVFLIGYLSGRLDELTPSDFDPSSPVRTTVEDAIADLPSLESARKEDGYHWAEYDSTTEVGSDYARRARRSPPRDLSNSRIREKLNEGNGWISGFNGTNHTERVRERFAEVEPGERDSVSKCPRLDWADQCGTLRAGTGKDRGSYQSIRPIHPDEDRVITIREAARIQGFPDWFQFHETKWHSFRMIGNSVPPELACSILSTLKNKIQ
jgi:DNA (cytosine-5)-methyltransferase 1